jgi:hypothetical protein
MCENFHLALSFAAISNGTLELDLSDCVSKQFTTKYEWNVVYNLIITNMVTMRGFHVISDKFNIDMLCS